MLTTSVEIATTNLMPRLLNRLSRASAKVNRPNALIGSAITNRATIQPARKPIEYRKPSYPEKAIIPQMPRNEAADR